MSTRNQNWSRIDNKTFDAVIIGAGINGASIFKKLSSMGYRVLILDKGDFSCGTSQASAMMIWGGLLYLKNLDIATVRAFSRDRDEFIRSFSHKVNPLQFRYILNKKNGRSKHLVDFALHLYWLLGMCERDKPKYQNQFDEQYFVNTENKNGSFLYQEGFLKQSDSRFVLDWIIDSQNENCVALNYCDIQECNYQPSDKLWMLSLSDSLSGRCCTAKAKIVINCAGPWTDRVNEQFRIQSPFRHVFSKGVFIGYERPSNHQSPLIFEMGEHGDTLTFIPWGPVSLWGPTETLVHSIEEGYTITPSDIHFLQDHAHRHLKSNLADSRIVSLRCGIRPLVVKKDFKANCYPLDLSRHHKVLEDRQFPWISVYGGKISGCLTLAKHVATRISGKLYHGKKNSCTPAPKDKKIAWERYPGVSAKVPSLKWCVENEFCWTLDDYLRRRTNIAQWIPREGLGFNDENFNHLASLAKQLPRDIRVTGQDQLKTYQRKVQEGFDRLVKMSHNVQGGTYEAA